MSLKTALAKRSTTEVLPADMIENSVISGYYYSGKLETEEEKARIFNASAGADYALREYANKTIALVNIYIEPIELTQKDEKGNPLYVTENDLNVLGEDGEPIPKTTVCPRMILFDDKGKSYGCCSYGAYNAIRKLCNLYGTPDTWKHPVNITPVIIPKGTKQILSIKLG